MKSIHNIFKTFTLSVVAIFIVIPVSVHAQQSADNGSNQNYTFSLKQAIDYSLAHTNEILNSQLDESIAKQKVRETFGIGLPQINGSVEFDDYVAKPITIIPAGAFRTGSPEQHVSFIKQYQATAGISASQLIFSGSYLVGLQAAKTYQELSTQNTKLTKTNVISLVTKAYYGVVIGQKQVQSLDANITKLQKTLEDTKALNKQGFAELLDVQRLEVALNNLEIQKRNANNLTAITVYALKFQLGMPISSTLTLTDSLPQQFPAPAMETVDFNKRVEYGLLKTSMMLNMLNVKRYNSDYLPSLAAFGTLSTNAYRDQFDFFNTSKNWFATGIVGAKLSIPIFNGFQTQARIQQAKMEVSKSKNSISSFENTVNFQVKQASLVYQNNFEALEIQKKNLDLAKEISRVTTIKYTQGVGSNLEVVTAETDLRTAQISYFSALYNLAVSQVDLMMAKGILY